MLATKRASAEGWPGPKPSFELAVYSPAFRGRGKTITDIVRIFHFTNGAHPMRIHETINAIRAIAEIVQ
jgi:hypothetical protein